MLFTSFRHTQYPNDAAISSGPGESYQNVKKEKAIPVNRFSLT